MMTKPGEQQPNHCESSKEIKAIAGESEPLTTPRKDTMAGETIRMSNRAVPAESSSSGLTFDEFAMGVLATLRATVSAEEYNAPDAAWDHKRSIQALREMGRRDPDFYTALTDVNPHASDEARETDASCRIITARMSDIVELPTGPIPAELEDLLLRSSLGPIMEARRWY